MTPSEFIAQATQTVVQLMKEGWKAEVLDENNPYVTAPTIRLTHIGRKGPMTRDFHGIPLTDELKELIKNQ